MPQIVDTPPSKNAARMIDAIVFHSLLLVIFLAAIPYGSVEPWWKAVFQCLIFAMAAVSIGGQLLLGETWPGLSRKTWSVLLPALALILFALVQAIPWSSANVAGIQVGRTLSADPFQTWLFAIHLASLVLLGMLLLKHTSSQSRLHLLIQVIVIIGVLSALFGIWRQVRQRDVGFFLPYLRPAFGYGQFVNSNHFAFLMELCLGLALGVVVGRGVNGKWVVIYLTAAVPMWIALVLANSRGGILSLLCQVIFLALLWGIKSEVKMDGETSEARGERRGRRRKEKSRLAHTGRRLAIRAVLVSALLAGAIVTVVLVGGDPLGGRLETIPTELDRRTADTAALRQSIWRATWDMVVDHPIAGSGFGGYAVAIPGYHRASGELTPQEAHNDYLELLASGGIIGLGIAIWFVVAFTRVAYRQVRVEDPLGQNFPRAATLGALAGILTVSIHSLVDFGLHIPINAWIVAALVAIVLMDLGEERSAEEL